MAAWLEAASSHHAGLEGVRIFRFHSPVFFLIFHFSAENRQAARPHRTKPIGAKPVLNKIGGPAPEPPPPDLALSSWGVCNFTGRGQQRPYTRSPAARPLRHQASAQHLSSRITSPGTWRRGNGSPRLRLVGCPKCLAAPGPQVRLSRPGGKRSTFLLQVVAAIG